MWFDIAARSEKLELLDGDMFDEADLRENLTEIELVNRLLGGHAASNRLLGGVLKSIKEKGLRIVDLGCGSGDTIRQWRHQWPEHHYTGIDINATAIEMARQADSNHSKAYLHGDMFAQRLSFDVVHMAMVNHHLTRQENVDMLAFVAASEVSYILINDLHRNYLAWAGIWLLTRLLPSSVMVKTDAPLSVKRAYSIEEWKVMLCDAGIKNYSISWAWAFRYLIVIDNR